MMLSSKCSECIATEKALFAYFISHPEFFAQNLLSHLLQSSTNGVRVTLIQGCARNASSATRVAVTVLVNRKDLVAKTVMGGSVDWTCFGRAAIC